MEKYICKDIIKLIEEYKKLRVEEALKIVDNNFEIIYKDVLEHKPQMIYTNSKIIIYIITKNHLIKFSYVFGKQISKHILKFNKKYTKELSINYLKILFDKNLSTDTYFFDFKKFEEILEYKCEFFSTNCYEIIHETIKNYNVEKYYIRKHNVYYPYPHMIICNHFSLDWKMLLFNKVDVKSLIRRYDAFYSMVECYMQIRVDVRN
jgi:hypothetical protein